MLAVYCTDPLSKYVGQILADICNWLHESYALLLLDQIQPNVAKLGQMSAGLSHLPKDLVDRAVWLQKN